MALSIGPGLDYFSPQAVLNSPQALLNSPQAVLNSISPTSTRFFFCVICPDILIKRKNNFHIQKILKFLNFHPDWVSHHLTKNGLGIIFFFKI